MSDIIDFDKIKNQVRDKDIDDFEKYIFSLYGKMGDGKMNIVSLNKSVMEYMKEKNISEEKFVEIQKSLMERYGFSMDDIGEQMNITNNSQYDKYRKTIGFQEKYKNRLKDFNGFYYKIKNEKNDCEIFISKENVLISSSSKVDLEDNELNEFLVSYKKLRENEKLKVKISENLLEYDY